MSGKDELKIVQCYYVDKEICLVNRYSGLGDYLRGTLYLYRYSKKINIPLYVSFSHHLLSNIMYSTYNMSLEDTKNIQYILYLRETNTPPYLENEVLTTKYIFTNNMTDISNISLDEKEFIKTNCLTPKINFLNEMNEKISALGLKDKLFTVFNVRTGDNGLVNKKTIIDKVLAERLLNIVKEKELDPKEVIFITDNTDLDMFLKEIGLKITGLQKVHLGHYNQTIEQVKDTMIEFFIMTKAKTILQFSNYSWGSGFSSFASILYDVPLVVVHKLLLFEIPKIISQSHNKKINKEISLHNPTYKYNFFTMEDNINFIRKEFPEFIDDFVNYENDDARFSVIKYFYLYSFGGIYTNLNSKSNIDCIVNADYDVILGGVVNYTDVIIAKPTDDFILYVISVIKRVSKLNIDIQLRTGYQLFKLCLLKYTRRYDDEDEFYKYIFDNYKEDIFEGILYLNTSKIFLLTFTSAYT